jgi:hypothetical protein
MNAQTKPATFAAAFDAALAAPEPVPGGGGGGCSPDAAKPVSGDPGAITPDAIVVATAPVRRSNFESALFETLIELKRIDDAIAKLDAEKAEKRADLEKALLSSDEQSIKFDNLGSASMAKGTAKVIVVDIDAVPDRFVKREPTVDTTAAGKALRAGGEVAGLKLGEEGAPVLRVVWAK